MIWEKFDYNNNCKIEVGAYAQVHEKPKHLNSMQHKTTGGIALGQATNI
jgi:hypothetical protein